MKQKIQAPGFFTPKEVSVATPQQLPDTPVGDVSLDRIVDILLMEGINHEVETIDEREYLRTGFNNFAVTITISNSRLIMQSLWRGEVPLNDGAALLSTISLWNQTHMAPVLHFGEMAGRYLAVLSTRDLDITHGLSRNQLGGFVMSTLESMNEATDYVENEFPNLVTWRYLP